MKSGTRGRRASRRQKTECDYFVLTKAVLRTWYEWDRSQGKRADERRVDRKLGISGKDGMGGQMGL